MSDLLKAIRRELWMVVRLRSIRRLAIGCVLLQVAAACALSYVLSMPGGSTYTRYEVTAFLFVKVPLMTLATGILGCLLAGAEYRYRTIDRSRLRTPSITILVASKLLSTAFTAVLLGAACLVAVLVVLAALGTGTGGAGSGQWAALAAGQLAGAGLVAAIGCLLAMAARSQVAAAITLLVWVLLGEPLARGLLRPLTGDLWADLLPVTAAQSLVPMPADLVGGLLATTNGGPPWGLLAVAVLCYLAVPWLVVQARAGRLLSGAVG